MGSVEQKLKPCPTCAAPCEYEVKMRGGDYGWSTTDEQRTFYKFNAAALREQPEALAVRFDPDPIQNDDSRIWTYMIDIGKHGAAVECHGETRELALTRAQTVFAALTAAQQPVQEGGGEYPEAAQVCAEAYQVVGSLLDDLGISGTERADKILDNLSQHKLVHKDVLPWPSFEKPAPPSAPVEAKARAMFEAQADKLSAPWDRQWEPTKQYWREKAHQALTQQPAQAAPGEFVVVDGRSYALDTVRTALLGLAADVAATAPVGLDPPVERQRDILAQAIRDAAVKAGIARADASMTGPMLLMLCDDMADCILTQQPAQAAPGDARAIIEEFVQCAGVGRPPGKLIAQAQDWLAATPPGDDAAGGA